METDKGGLGRHKCTQECGVGLRLLLVRESNFMVKAVFGFGVTELGVL
jgi:hypothetical protein